MMTDTEGDAVIAELKRVATVAFQSGKCPAEALELLRRVIERGTPEKLSAAKAGRVKLLDQVKL